MNAFRSIRFWVWKCWVRFFFSRLFQGLAGAFVLIFFLFPVLAHGGAYLEQWHPELQDLLLLEATSLGLFFLVALFLSAPGTLGHFARTLDGQLEWSDRLETWVDLRGRSLTRVGALFQERLHRDLSAAKVGRPAPVLSLRWKRYLFFGGLVLHLLFLLPGRSTGYWGKGAGPGPDPDAGAVAATNPGSGSEGGQGTDSPASRPDPGFGQSPEQKEAPDGPPQGTGGSGGVEDQEALRLVPRYVPALRKEGPTSLKEIFVYDLEPTTSSSPSKQGRYGSFAAQYPRLRKSAEDAIHREILDDEERAFVLRYFEKIRP